MPQSIGAQVEKARRAFTGIGKAEGDDFDDRVDDILFAMPALLRAASESLRFYGSDGFQKMGFTEVRRRRIEAARRLKDYERLREGLERMLKTYYAGGPVDAAYFVYGIQGLLNDGGDHGS